MRFKSEQEIFEYVIKFLIKQGKRSVTTKGDCAYRGKDNMKCAVGCILSDHYYRIGMEGGGMKRLLEFKLPKFIREFSHFLTDLQRFHDFSSNWTNNGIKLYAVKFFAEKHNLNTDFLNEG